MFPDNRREDFLNLYHLDDRLVAIDPKSATREKEEDEINEVGKE